VIITSEQELDEILSRPSEADVTAMRELPGDVMILGAGGKMGPSLVRRAARAAGEAGTPRRVTAVARFTEPQVRQQLEAAGVATIAADLLEPGQLARLPDAENVIFMAGRKFGSTGAEHLTWAMNGYMPALVAQRYSSSRIVAFSSGNVYPFVPVVLGGANESTPPAPVGEYAQSVLGRERMFEYFSMVHGTRVVLLRLNYAIDLRYGVLLDIATKVYERQPVDVSMGAVNVIWQGDANSVALRSFSLCASPPAILNVTGPETLSVRRIAARFGDHFGIEPAFQGAESGTALLSNASRCHRFFGYPEVSVETMIEWIARWIELGGTTLNRPTHFEARDGKF
jgi:nucleoside-diphosphate-sugar epimerase